MSLQCVAGSLGLWLGEERQNAPLTVDDHGDLPIQAALAQAALDLFRLDAEATDFHLIVAPPAQLDTVLSPLGHVAATVGAQGFAAGQ